MKFSAPLIRATLIKRYKRFLSDHKLACGTTVTAHCANTGSMLGLAEPGLETWLSLVDNPRRKLRYSWEMIRTASGARGLVGINTAHPNGIVAEAIQTGHITELAGYANIRREVKYGENSRIDILLEADDVPPCYVEVKNVHFLRRGGVAEFPDSITKRGTKHLRELTGIAESGGRAVMLYLVQRGDCDSFSLAADIDPAYAEAFGAARNSGVEALCYACRLDQQEIRLDRHLPITTSH